MDQARERQRRETLARFLEQQVDRRRVLRGAAGMAALPVAARTAPARAAFTGFTPAAVTAAQRALRQSGDSAAAAVAAANALDPKPAELNTVWEAGLIAQDPINFSGPLWEEATGIKVNVIERPFTELYSSALTEHLAGTGGFDVLNVAYAWLPDFIAQGVLEPLDPLIDQYMNKADLDDYHPTYRTLMNYGGQIHALPTDGDVITLYYRTDLFEDQANKDAFQERYGYELAAPTTWREYDEIQAFFTERLAPDAFGGASQRSPGQVYGWFLEEFRNRGGEFFDAETMDATLASEAGVDTLSRMLASNQTMPPGVEIWGFLEVLTAWMAGELAMIGGTWPPIGRWSEGYGAGTVQLEFVPASQVAGKVGYAVMPLGHPELNAGFMMGVSADSPNKEAAYLFNQWATSPTISLQRVMLPYSLHDPFRLSHYRSEEYRRLWPSAGAYLDTLEAGAAAGLLDIMLPGSAEYHTAVDQMVTAAQAGTPVEQALSDGNAAFDAISDRIGRDQLKAAYAQYLALGLVYPS